MSMNHKGSGRTSLSAKRPPLASAQEVWAHNLELEMYNIRVTAESYPQVALEVLLPKIVASPAGPFGEFADYNYQMLRCNVDLTRALQISLTLSDTKGNRPRGTSTWRFNFDFNPRTDFSQAAVKGKGEMEGTWAHMEESLDQSVDLSKHRSQGIRTQDFGELLMTSGLVLSEDVKWIAFCAVAGMAEGPLSRVSIAPSEPHERRFCGMYSFGYLLQLLTCQEMPDCIDTFLELLDLFFPSRCDLADHIARLPHIISRDPSDPLKRPLFCSAQHVLDAFFRLPESVRQTAFEQRSEEGSEEPEAAGLQSNGSQRRGGTRRRQRDGHEANGVTGRSMQ